MTLSEENDLFRTTLLPSPKHRVVLSEIVADHADREYILTAVRAYNDFAPDNDPYGEHDFGAVKIHGQTYYFKIDYYDLTLEFGADPKEEPHIKVLTIMHSSEY